MMNANRFITPLLLYSGIILILSSCGNYKPLMRDIMSLHLLETESSPITDTISGAGVILTQSSGSTSVSEGGDTDTYDIVLATQPAASVTVSVSPDTQTNVNGSAAATVLIFTTGNWDTPQTVTVGARIDSLVEGIHSGTISHTSSSTDPDYNSIPISDVVASIADSPFPAWTRRRKITFDNSAQSESLVNFPVLVVLNSSNIDYSQTQNNGEDIRFHDADGTTELAYEIEKWDETGNSYVWVQVPTIDASSSTDHIWLYYGNSLATDGQNASNVWNNNYESVMHLNDGNYLDSTENGNDGIPSGSPSHFSGGQIGNAREFLNASAQYVTVPTAGWSANEGTVEGWAYPFTTSPGNRYVFSHRMGNTNTRIYLLTRNGIEFWIGIGDCLMGGVCGNGNTGSSLSLFTWQHLVMTWDSGTFNVYRNGTKIVSSAPYDDSSMSIDITASVGQYTGGGEYWNGAIDEIRMSSIARSPDWIAAQYLSMTDSFLTFGAEESF